MANVSLRSLEKTYSAKGGADVRVVHGINLEIRDREFMVLVGPSGCGKSTTLRMIAGLEDISGGTVEIDGEAVNDLPPKDRDIAMVFQNYALYPHMSVYDNMAFGLKMRKFPRDRIDERVREATQMLALEPYLDRKPKALSGGQRQRVAVGRAIVRRPKVFLFDEPLSNLDAKMRASTRTDIAKLHARLGATMIYVTHDQVEAMTMGDRICVMKDGRIMQVADPLTLYNHPANMFVAGFIGSPPMNFFTGSLARAGNAFVFQEENETSHPCSVVLPERLVRGLAEPAGRRVVLGIRPENLAVMPASESTTANADSPARSISCRVEVAEPMGAETVLHLHTGGHAFLARVAPTHRHAPGAQLQLYFDSDKLHLFDAETEAVLGDFESPA